MMWQDRTDSDKNLTISQLNVVIDDLREKFHDVAVDVWHEARDKHGFLDSSLCASVRTALGEFLNDLFSPRAERFGVGVHARKLPETSEALQDRLEQFFRGAKAVIEHTANTEHKNYLAEHADSVEEALAEAGTNFLRGFSSRLDEAKTKSAVVGSVQ